MDDLGTAWELKWEHRAKCKRCAIALSFPGPLNGRGICAIGKALKDLIEILQRRNHERQRQTAVA